MSWAYMKFLSQNAQNSCIYSDKKYLNGRIQKNVLTTPEKAIEIRVFLTNFFIYAHEMHPIHHHKIEIYKYLPLQSVLSKVVRSNVIPRNSSAITWQQVGMGACTLCLNCWLLAPFPGFRPAQAWLLALCSFSRFPPCASLAAGSWLLFPVSALRKLGWA